MSAPTEKEISIPWPGKTAIVVTLTTPPKDVAHSGFSLILGPGAGGDEKTALLTSVAKEAAKQGHYCARYRAKVPNLGFRVSLCVRVMEHLFHPTTGLYPQKGCFHGGHSMGTRVAGTVASQITAASESSPKISKGKNVSSSKAKDTDSKALSSADFPSDFVSGLIFYSYPLHTADNTKALRDQILYDIPDTTPTLFVSGLSDTMCQPSIFAKVFKDMKSSPREAIQVQGADHGLGFGSSKPGQAKKTALIESISEWTIAFIDETIANSTKNQSKKASSIAISKKAELKKTGDDWTVSVSTTA